MLNAGPVVISEFMAVNDSTVLDADGDDSDWIEIHNPTTATVSLNGWYLTDDDAELTKWQFPDVSLAPDEYRIVFASGKNRTDLTGPGPAQLHTNFQLDGDGEYLALVRDDGATVAWQFAPEFPEQFADVSYGLMQGPSSSVLEGADLKYLVPTAAEELLGTTWTELAFDDSAFTPVAQSVSVRVTEAGTENPDFAEIQNLADRTVDTSGWVVAVNDADRSSPDINLAHTQLWDLPPTMSAGEVRYRTDDVNDNYWGANIRWYTNASGWVIILDGAGFVVDFVVWGYTTEEIASFDVTINDFHVTAEGIWGGSAVVPDGADTDSFQRTGVADHDDSSDWTSAAVSKGSQNDGLTTPFPTDASLGIGFEANRPGLGSAVDVDIQADVHHVNASLWTRIPFQVDNPAVFDTMRLPVQYNDGFVAYLNGQEIARRNAPDSPQWDSRALVARSVAESLEPESIDVSEFLGALRWGTNVLAVQAMNVSPDDDNFLIRPELMVTSMRDFDHPTPGAPNAATGFLGVVRDTRFDVDRGFYDAPFDVTITTRTAGAEIRYTTDGSTPTATNGSIFTTPVTVDTTTTLRAAAFKPEFIPTNVDTQTYLFLDDVVQQNGAGFPNTWGSSGADYEVDPEIAGAAPFIDANGDEFNLQDALRAIPTLSMVMDVNDWFGSSQGIYPRGENVEKAVSAEWLYGDGSEGFQIDASVEIVGGSSVNRWKSDKLSMRLKFKRPYGAPNLDFPIFGDGSFGEGADDRFDTLVVDARLNFAWNYGGGSSPTQQRRDAQYIRDQFTADIQNAMGGYGPHGVAAHVYINGLYWGLHRIHERPDEHFGQSYLGGDDDDYYVMKHRSSTVVHPDAAEDPAGAAAARSDYNMMFTIAGGGLAGDAQYQLLQEYLDVPDFIDYMIANFYIGNDDWAHQNWYATRNAVDPAGRWRYHSWDAEKGMQGRFDNVTGKDNDGGPTRLHQRLTANAEYRMLFADRLHRHFFNDGVLTVENARALYRARADEIDRAIVGESARWGDNRRSTPYTRDVEWIAERDRLLGPYMEVRTGTVLGQLRNRNLYPSVEPPTFSQHGGQVAPGFTFTISAPAGTIYYMLDGTDPRLPGGAIRTGALVYDGTSIVLGEPATAKARVRDGGTWSALTEAFFLVGEAATAANLVISEINYNPHDPTPAELAAMPLLTGGDFEFIELRNMGQFTVLLHGVKFTDGVDFAFGTDVGSVLAPGGSVVVAMNPAAYQLRYPTAPAPIDRYEGKLRNGGERIELRDFFGNPIARFRYNDAGSWPGRADAKGATLELIDPQAVPPADPERTAFLENGDNWRSSSEYGGSPGAVGTGPLEGVVVNEVLTNTPSPMLDAIELINNAPFAIDVGGWYLSDSWGWEWNQDNGNYKKFRIPDGTTIAARGYLVFDEEDFNPSGGVDPPLHPNDFALNGNHGDDVWLMEADAAGNLIRFADHAEFTAAAEGESWGRWPNGFGRMYPMTTTTLDKANPQNGLNSGPRIGPLIISEVHYNPNDTLADDDLEFVEIYNSTSAAIDLTDWRIRKGIDFDFPAGATLGAYSALVVLPFELGDTARWSAFSAEYGLDPAITDGFYGGYRQRLSDAGERIQLQRPGRPAPDEPGFIPRLLEDEVRYEVVAPWPNAAGNGRSLNRTATDAWGNTDASWIAAPPTPGTTTFPIPVAEVVDRLIFYNNSAFDGNDPGADARDDDAIAPDKEALLPGSSATLANYTSYVHGINGIMVDVAGMPAGASPGIGDFEFRIGNNNDPGGWLPLSATPEITVRPGEGTDGSDRITLIWSDNAELVDQIRQQWLQVTVRATATTGLASEDVFYFGNAIGESGNSTANARVDVADMLGVRDNQRSFLEPAPIDFRFDFDRDARVDVVDLLIARNHQTHFLNDLKLISVPGGKGDAEGAQLEDAAAHDAVLRQAVRRPRNAESWPEELDWLAEFDELRARRRPAHGSRPAEIANGWALLDSY